MEKIRWEALDQLRIKKRETVLFLRGQAWRVLPTEQIPADALKFMKQCLATHQKKVVDKR
jgi:hypothetical protein